MLWVGGSRQRIMPLSGHILPRFSARLKFQDRSECGNITIIVNSDYIGTAKYRFKLYICHPCVFYQVHRIINDLQLSLLFFLLHVGACLQSQLSVCLAVYHKFVHKCQ